MTREEAITALGDRNNLLWGMSKEEQKYYSEALDMAISALSESKCDLISRQAVLDELEKWDWQDLYLPIHFKQILDDVPSVENKGKWEKIWRTDCECSEYMCSKCGCGEDYYTDFCPNCGADMRGR